MKAPITLSKLGMYARISALTVIYYTLLGHVIETLHSPKTAAHFLGLITLQFSVCVVLDIYITRRKKSTAPSGDGAKNGDVK